MTHTRAWLSQLQESEGIRRRRLWADTVGEPVDPMLLGADKACPACKYLSCDCTPTQREQATLSPGQQSIVTRVTEAAQQVGRYVNHINLDPTGVPQAFRWMSTQLSRKNEGIEVRFADLVGIGYTVLISQRDLENDIQRFPQYREVKEGELFALPDGKRRPALQSDFLTPEQCRDRLALSLAFHIGKDQFLANLLAGVHAKHFPCPLRCENYTGQRTVFWAEDRYITCRPTLGLDELCTAYEELSDG